MSADSISTSQPLSPFLLLVHHQHSFMPFDPTRTITNLFLPEGFPAHPHSGFSTVTITIDGGLKHRDSEGIIMDYGDGDTQCMTLTHSLMRLLTYLLTNLLKGWQVDVVLFTKKCGIRTKIDTKKLNCINYGLIYLSAISTATPRSRY